MGLKTDLTYPLSSHRDIGTSMDSSYLVQSNQRLRESKLPLHDKDQMMTRRSQSLTQSTSGGRRRVTSIMNKLSSSFTHERNPNSVMETHRKKYIFPKKKDKKINYDMPLFFMSDGRITEIGTTSRKENNYAIGSHANAENDDETTSKIEESKAKVVKRASELKHSLEEKLAGKGFESPFIQVNKIIPSFRDIHLHLGLNISRSISSSSEIKSTFTEELSHSIRSRKSCVSTSSVDHALSYSSEETTDIESSLFLNRENSSEARPSTEVISHSSEDKVLRNEVTSAQHSVHDIIEERKDSSRLAALAGHELKYHLGDSESEFDTDPGNDKETLSSDDSLGEETVSELDRLKEKCEDVSFLANYMYSVPDKQQLSGHGPTPMLPTSLCVYKNRRIKSYLLLNLLENEVLCLHRSESNHAINHASNDIESKTPSREITGKSGKKILNDASKINYSSSSKTADLSSTQVQGKQSKRWITKLPGTTDDGLQIIPPPPSDWMRNAFRRLSGEKSSRQFVPPQKSEQKKRASNFSVSTDAAIMDGEPAKALESHTEIFLGRIICDEACEAQSSAQETAQKRTSNFSVKSDAAIADGRPSSTRSLRENLSQKVIDTVICDEHYRRSI